MNIIDRNNYEEYFLLYIDDELTAAERKAVEDFVVTHPDLKIELEMLERSTLPADHIVFHDKDSLLKNSSLLINTNNYEEYFVLYADDELNNEQKDSVEQFVFRYPQYQAEFELIQKARLQPDNHLVFPDKSLLYRTEEEDEKVFVLPWGKIAAAAIVLIFLSGLSWFFLSDKTDPAIVNNRPQKESDNRLPSEKQPKVESIVRSQPLPEQAKPVTSEAVAVQRKNTVKPAFKKSKEIPEYMIANTEAPDKIIEGRNIQMATNVTERHAVTVDKVERSNGMALKNDKEIIDEAVGPIEENEYAYTASDDEIEILNTSISKKNKLRGLFRKVSRVVEKTTSIDPNDVKGIRIANFEIAIK
jgi:hypothetical protein